MPHKRASMSASNPGGSYIYPVRSLLSGVQPAQRSGADEQEPGAGPSSPSTGSELIRDFPAGSFQRSVSFVTGPTGEPVPVSPTLTDTNIEYNSRHPASLQSAVDDSGAFTGTSDSLLPGSNSESPAEPLPFNPSEAGIVHLPPLPNSPPSRSGPSSSSAGSSIGGRFLAAGTSSSSGGFYGRGSNPSGRSSRSESQEVPSSGSESLITSEGDDDYSREDSERRSEGSGPILTARLEAKQDENGHHVIIGREGNLTKCEDEPIRTPGAIQGFGVLIAVDEKEDILEVRQVSENSGDLLGLSPKYLFSLECFTDALPDSQAALLWDNIQFLSEPDLNTAEDEEGAPHVFLLSGWGEPGSALPSYGRSPSGEDPPDDSDAESFSSTSTLASNNDPEHRRTWTSWCAVHRPIQPNPSRLSDEIPPPDLNAMGHAGGLVILEFELERDLKNPLYPPITVRSTTSSDSSTPYSISESSESGSGSSVGGNSSGGFGGGNSSDGSERTLVGAFGAAVAEGSARARHSNLSSSTVMEGGAEESATPVPPASISPAHATSFEGDLFQASADPGVTVTALIRDVDPTPIPGDPPPTVPTMGTPVDPQDTVSFDPTTENPPPESNLPIIVTTDDPNPITRSGSYSGSDNSSSQASYRTAPSVFQPEGAPQPHNDSSLLNSASSLFINQNPSTSGGANFYSSHRSSAHSAISPHSNTSLAPRGEWQPSVPTSLAGLEGEDDWVPSPEDILDSTTTRSKPLLALERLRRMTRSLGGGGDSPNVSPDPHSRASRRAARRSQGAMGASGGVGMMDVFAVMGQINEQLGEASDLEMFLKVVVGVIKDLTQFHRVLVYQFDEAWNGQTVAELVDWSQTHDLYKGLHFPASDIPAQARELYTINKVRLLYDRSQPTARLVVRSREDLDPPLNMTHCYLRAMSPIHIQYLGNMGVRASMSVSIMAFGALWGLIACHSYGSHGMRVSFPVRQMLRLISQSVSRNIERLSYAQRLHTRKLINTVASDHHPTGYIISNADDLLGLFDADYGILVVGEGAKILGPNQHGQEILIIAEYLRLKQFTTIQVSQGLTGDYPDLMLSTGLEVIAGMLYVPLSSGGRDFIAFLRKGQPRDVHWAGKPFKEGVGPEQAKLEPRKSFKIWSETVAGRCRVWTDEQLETAGVLALVYGKFIEVWRQKENALQTTKLTNLLLSNASHEVRTPLNHIINYLEMALNGPLDLETRDNLRRSHSASKSLLFTINDLLDLTRLESGNETSFNEPFDLQSTIEDAVQIYRKEAERRNLKFDLNVQDAPNTVIGDSKKIRTVVQNLTANALKYTEEGTITVFSATFEEPDGLRDSKQTAVEIVVADTGKGIEPERLESIFREFEQVESSEPKTGAEPGVGLGLAVVARIVEQLGGQLRVDSQVGEGSRFSFLIPLALPSNNSSDLSLSSRPGSDNSSVSSLLRARTTSIKSKRSEVDSLVEALASDHMVGVTAPDTPSKQQQQQAIESGSSSPTPSISGPGTFEITDSNTPLRPIKMDMEELDRRASRSSPRKTTTARGQARQATSDFQLRVLIVEDNDINRNILAKRLKMTGHIVVNTMNGQEGSDMIESDSEFDCVLMDIQMPILDGYQATERIRAYEKSANLELSRPSHHLNGRIPIFAVSASLFEPQRAHLAGIGFDGWILKPIDFKRLNVILFGVVDGSQRQRDLYRPGCSWELGGWLCDRLSTDNLGIETDPQADPPPKTTE